MQLSCPAAALKGLEEHKRLTSSLDFFIIIIIYQKTKALFFNEIFL